MQSALKEISNEFTERILLKQQVKKRKQLHNVSKKNPIFFLIV